MNPAFMPNDATIFVAGAGGMVGSAIVRRLQSAGYTNIIGSYHHSKPDPAIFVATPDSNNPSPGLTLVQLDLRDQSVVNRFFSDRLVQYVFLAAARVGGIHANNTYPATFIYENLAIQSNVIHAAYKTGVSRLLFLGSSCIYPKLAPQPLTENALLTGPLEPTNEPYAIAKIAGIKMCEAYNRQYGTTFIAVMPTNLYGLNDDFDMEYAHVLPALMRKFHTAKVTGQSEVVVWGSGSPRREFMYVEDMADAAVFVMNLEKNTVKGCFLNFPRPCYVNVGTGVDCTIRELAETIKTIVSFNGRLVFDRSKPDGTPQKKLDVSLLHQLGWHHRTNLHQGIQLTYRWFVDHFA